MRHNWAVWVVLALLVAVGFVWKLVDVYGGIHHPYMPALFLLLLGIGLLALVALMDEPETRRDRVGHKIVDGIGEALIVVCVVVVLFEIPDFKDFYEAGIRRILTTRAYVEQLSADEQRNIVESVVLSRLGNAADSAAGRAYTLDLYREIDQGQYVRSDERYFQKEWPSQARDSMTIVNRMTRRVLVFGQQSPHNLSDYVAGSFNYWLLVDKMLCLEISDDPSGHPRKGQSAIGQKLCGTRITDQARGHIVKVSIPLTRGEHVVERVIRRREKGLGSLATSFTLDYFTQSLSLRYHYPSDFVLEVFGEGDLESPLTDLSVTTTAQGDQSEFEQSFDNGWFGRGAGAALLLAQKPETEGTSSTERSK
jgi:hypothetical protein